jgi:hypothetical protein
MNPRMPLKLGCLVALTIIGLLGTGCGGVNSGVGVSPASFLLPGLIQHQPEPTSPFDAPVATNNVVVAQVH